jgi:PAS domain S-box-containing protein
MGGRIARQDRDGESRQQLALLLDAVRDCALIQLGRTGRVVRWGERARQIAGYDGKEMRGKTLSRICFVSDDGKVSLKRCQSAAAESGTCESTGRCKRKDGSTFSVRLVCRCLRDHANSVTGFAVLLQDISLQSRAAQLILEHQRRTEAIVKTAVDAIITIDERGIIESVNPATTRLFGYAEAELIGRNVKMLMPDPYQREHDQYLRNYLRTSKAKIIGIGREVTAMRKDGMTFPISLSVSEVRLGGTRRMFTGIIHDLSARLRLEQQIIEASTSEQRRIGQDLHDGLCQELVGIALQADMTVKRLEQRGADESKAVRALAASVREVATEARRLSHGLNPVDLKAGGLTAALKVLADRVTQSFGTTCKLHWDRRAEVAEDTTATQLYRIAQESINNAIRHGKADRIDIRLRAAGDVLKLEVHDNGVGFTPGKSAITSPHTADEAAVCAGVGIGLATMRYRTNMIGGIFDVRSRPTRGTVVAVAVRAATNVG